MEVLNAIRGVMSPKQSPRERLAQSCAEVRRLQRDLEEIQRGILAKTDISEWRRRAEADRARWEADQSNLELKREWKLSVLILESENRRIQPELAAQKYLALGEHGYRELFAKNRGWRLTLRQACQAELELAEARFSEVNARVRQELASHRFPENALERHPLIAKAKESVALWKGLVRRCDNKQEEDVVIWKAVVRHIDELDEGETKVA
jgi:hypothetical protein